MGIMRRNSASSTSKKDAIQKSTKMAKEVASLTGAYQRSQVRGSFDDLILLEKPNNERIVDILKTRLASGEMYTNIGQVLVAVNPYQRLSKGGKSLTDESVARFYYGADILETAPHVFRTGAEAYHNLVKERENQCIIITGESGAGKTETAKHLMSFVTVVGGKSEASKCSSDDIRTRLLETNPVLEAFGNAKTMRNDNSSRFGKYMELLVEKSQGQLYGGKVTNYLLERSRVPSQANGERNFHIFHYLLAGSSKAEAESLQLLPAQEYRYLSTSAGIRASEDSTGLEGVKQALRSVDIDDSQQKSIMHMLSAVLALGNLDFIDHGDGLAATIACDDALKRAASQLGVPSDTLGSALTKSTLRVGGLGATGTLQVRNLNAQDSTKNRDTLAKEIYKRLFDFIVERINVSIKPPSDATPRARTSSLVTMGILDIYGFEVMERNGFEQFCINYVNEKLQQYFIDHTIKAEQDEYIAEAIEWDKIDFYDNSIVCESIEGRGGLFSLLDEVGAHRSSTANELINTYNQKLGSKPCYIIGRDASYEHAKVQGLKSSQRMEFATIFGIEHYAGRVIYDAEGFLERNADSLWGDLVNLLAESSNAVAAAMFEDRRSGEEKAKRPPSLSLQFRRQVKDLTATLATCRPHYVRCIKPNDTKSPKGFSDSMVVHQVKYLGLNQNILVRQQGFVHRMTFTHFVRRYGLISKQTWPDRLPGQPWKPSSLSPREATVAILTGKQPKTWNGKKLEMLSFALDGSDVALGKTKVFLRRPEILFKLEDQRSIGLPQAATILQTAVRRWVRYSKYRTAQRVAPKLHALARKFICRSKLYWLIDCKRLMDPVVYKFSRALSNGVTVTVSRKGVLGVSNQIEAILTSHDAGRTLSLIQTGGAGVCLLKSTPIDWIDAIVAIRRVSKSDENKAIVFRGGKKMSIKCTKFDENGTDFAASLSGLHRYHQCRGGMTPTLGSPLE